MEGKENLKSVSDEAKNLVLGSLLTVTYLTKLNCNLVGNKI